MKKMIALSAMVLLLLTGTSAFAGTGAAKKMSDGLYNGVTYFEMGTSVPCCNTATSETASSGTRTAFSNGITFFGADVQAPGEKSVCACGINSTESRQWPKNGITIFS